MKLIIEHTLIDKLIIIIFQLLESIDLKFNSHLRSNTKQTIINTTYSTIDPILSADLLPFYLLSIERVELLIINFVL